MLSIKQAIRSYYEQLAREDYYTNGGEPLGQFAGQGATKLGLQGTVSKKAIRHLFNGLSPDGDPLVQLQKGKKHQPAWDLTFSAPKSVSIAFALADEPSREKIAQGHRAAVKEAISYIEAHAAWGRRGKGGEIVERVSLVFLLYEHHTSRAQDMQLHTHGLCMNIGVRADGSTGTITSRDLYLHKMAAGAIYRAELARQMKLLGFVLRKGEHSFELACVPQKVIDGFSKRSAEIRETMAKEGSSGSRAAELAAVSTRQRKGHVERPALSKKWKREACELGLRSIEPGRTPPSEKKVDLARILAREAKALAEERAFFHDRELTQRVASKTEHLGLGAAVIRQGVGSFLEANKDIEILPEKRFSTKAHVAKERVLLDLAVRSKEDRSHVVDEKHFARVERKFPNLSVEQRAALRHITQGDAITMLTGLAGTGKTTLLRAARELWEAQGLEVVGTCVSKNAANTLEREAGIRSRTLASLLRRIDQTPVDRLKHHGMQLARAALGKKTWTLERHDLTPSKVVVIDESSMASTAQISKVVQAARKKGAKIVLVGDPAQLGAVEGAGGAFAALCKGVGRASLQDIKRQREPWMRKASLQFAEGDMASGLSLYATAGKITVSPTRDEAKRALVDTWFKGRGDLKDTLLLAGTRVDVRDLNHLAQQRRIEAGELGKTFVTVNGDRLFVGDRVSLTRNHARLRLTNGDTARIERITPALVAGRSKLSLILDGPGEELRRVSFNLRAYDHVALGYASTVHKAQGQTVDRSLVLAGGWMQDRELTYVEMTRHREDCRIFVSEAEAGEDLSELVRATKKSRAKETALDFERELQQRREQELRRSEREQEREHIPT